MRGRSRRGAAVAEAVRGRGSSWGWCDREGTRTQTLAPARHDRGGAAPDPYRTAGRRLDTLVDPDTGRTGRDREGRGGQDLGRSQPEAVASRDVQGQQRPALRGEARRC